MWAEEDRPAQLQSKDVINNMRMSDIMAVMSGTIEISKLGEKSSSMKGVTKDEKVPTKNFKKPCKDNCREKLHPARWLRMPLTPQSEWYQNVPVKMSPIVVNAIQLDVTGTEDQVLAETIRLMHDRRVVLELRMFYIGNFDSSKGQKGRQLEFATSMLQIQEALTNFQGLLQQIFPLDTTATSMWRVLVVYKWVAVARSFDIRRDVIILFFHTVSRKNAQNAGNNLPPISYAKQEMLFKKTLRKFKLKEEIPTGEDLEPEQKPAGNRNQKSSGGNGGKGGNGGNKSQSQNKKVRAQKDGRLVCLEYNNKDSCPNEEDGPGCKKEVKGEMKFFYHCCNMMDKATKKHCLGPHPRKDHK